MTIVLFLNMMDSGWLAAHINETRKDKLGWVTLLGGFSYLSVTCDRTLLFEYMCKKKVNGMCYLL